MSPAFSPLDFRLLAPEQFSLIGPLWEELNAHHASLPTPFASAIAAREFAPRLQMFCDKAAVGRLSVEVACLASDELPIAYCMTSLSPHGAGEIDSLYVTPSHRRSGVGSELVRRALEWLRASGAVSQRVVVLHGNAEAEAFYRRFGFIRGTWRWSYCRCPARNIRSGRLSPTTASSVESWSRGVVTSRRDDVTT